MATMNPTSITVTGVLQPHNDFAGRSNFRFGVGEMIDLGFTASPLVSADQLGGLRWFIAQGGGTLSGSGANDGRALFTAAATPGPVTLVLKITSGPNANMTVATRGIEVVAPTDGVMLQNPGSGLLHLQGTWSCGFQGLVFLRPTDVSFTNVLVGEGGTVAVRSGFLIQLDENHPVGPLVTVGPGDAQHGCQLNITDEVSSGILDPPFSPGDFQWTIPWEFSVNGSPRVRFTTAAHHAQADANGRATIAKKGAGPFSKVPGDPDSGF
jgi:hypothetical protein